MKLNIGSGLKKLDDFINLDHDKLVDPDILINIESAKLPFPECSVEEIRAHHILEHIGENFLPLMQELYRISKDGAIIDIAVPHPRHDNYFGDPTHRRPITPLMLQQFSKKYCKHHRETHGSSTGFADRLDVDFEIVNVNYSVDEAYNIKEYSKQEIQDIAHRFNNVYKDIYILLLVVKS